MSFLDMQADLRFTPNQFTAHDLSPNMVGDYVDTRAVHSVPSRAKPMQQRRAGSKPHTEILHPRSSWCLSFTLRQAESKCDLFLIIGRTHSMKEGYQYEASTRQSGHIHTLCQSLVYGVFYVLDIRNERKNLGNLSDSLRSGRDPLRS